MQVTITVNDRLVEGLRRIKRVCTRKRLICAIGIGAVGTSVAMAAPLSKRHSFHSGDLISAAQINENFDQLFGAFDNMIIRAPLVVPVADCAELVTALSDLAERRIGPAGRVRIEIAAGHHACKEAIYISHVDGPNLTIAGVGATPGDVVLSFPAGKNGLRLFSGQHLGSLTNLTLEGGGDGTGIAASSSSSAELEGVVVRKFSDGILAIHNSFLVLTSVTAEECGRNGVEAGRTSTVRLDRVTSRNNVGYGFAALEASCIVAVGASTASGNGEAGFAAGSNSVIELGDVTASDNYDGLHAYERGHIIANAVTATGNQRDALHVGRNGSISLGVTPITTGSGNAANLAVNTVRTSDGSVINY